MAIFKIELDQLSYEKLLTIALRERRPTHWQAEVLLIQALAQHEDPLTPVRVEIDKDDSGENESA